jgi:hypothetical protein
MLMTMVLGAALAAGAALAYGLAYLHPVIPISSSGLSQLAGVPVLGEVSIAFPERARRAARLETLKIAVAACCLIAAFGTAVILSQTGYRLTVPAIKRLVSP